jgi:hypothetical protein
MMNPYVYKLCLLKIYEGLVVQVLDLVLKQHGLEEYKEKSVNHDVPLSKYVKLKGFTSIKN